MVLVMQSCKSNFFLNKEIQLFHFQNSYNKQDSLHLSDFIFYGISEEPNFRLKIDLNDDSLYNILKGSLSKLKLPIHYKSNKTNYSNLSYFIDKYLPYEKINKSLIFKSANSFNDKHLIFPVLQLYFRQRINFDPSITVYPRYYCYLSLAIFIVKNREVLYYKQVRHEEVVNKEYHPYEFEDYHVPISQENWDGLVKEVMKEYIERLE